MATITERQIEGLAHELRTKKTSLLESAREELVRWSEHPIGELAGEVPDAGDDSVASLVTDLEHSALQRRVAALNDIDAALARIDGREYAICIDCGDDIDYRRLAAFPTANRCIDCQSRRERIYAHGAMPSL